MRFMFSRIPNTHMRILKKSIIDHCHLSFIMYSCELSPKDKVSHLKIVVIGHKGVGKTTLLNSFTKEHTCADTSFIPTIGLDIVSCSYEKMSIKIFDYSGEKHCKTLVHGQCKDAHGILLVYDVTNRDSFEFRDDITVINKMNGIENEVPLFLIGNKIDNEDSRQVGRDEGKLISDTFAMLGFWETSAKLKNQRHVFLSILHLLQEFSKYKEQSKHLGFVLKQNQLRFKTDFVVILFQYNQIIKEAAKKSWKKLCKKLCQGHRWG